MKRKLLVVIAVLTFGVVTAGPAFADEHHPPKFGVQSTQCSSGANQPNCPGGH
jgi:hypothetical protein